MPHAERSESCSQRRHARPSSRNAVCDVGDALEHCSRIGISAYLGNSTTFDNAIADFAETNADQNERDYATLAAAGASGQVETQSCERIGPESGVITPLAAPHVAPSDPAVNRRVTGSSPVGE